MLLVRLPLDPTTLIHFFLTFIGADRAADHLVLAIQTCSG